MKARHERRSSLDALSDISDELTPRRAPPRDDRAARFRNEHQRPRFEPYHDNRREESPTFRSRYALRNPQNADKEKEKRAPNYEYKVKLADEKRRAAEDSLKKTLAYHEKNPEKHPLYPEEWKKFWNRRYKEIQTEGKDPSKHDFKPEWIVFWTGRMKELHDEELRVNVLEIYRKFCLTPPDLARRSPPQRRRSPDHRRAPDRRRTPEHRRDRRSPERRRSPPRRVSPPRRNSPPRYGRVRSRSPRSSRRSPARTHFKLESVRRSRSRSPLSRRAGQPRNRSPHAAGPASHTVLISDDEMQPVGTSPWNSDNDLDSLGSLPDAKSPLRSQSRAGSGSVVSSRASKSRAIDMGSGRSADPQDLGPAENVVATLRLLVALEDYLGSLGPKIVDLLTEALKMEKEAANSSEELLDRESAVVLMETAKEKLKGAAQAGLVAGGAAAAVRAAVVRVAATLHEADNRAARKQSMKKNGGGGGGGGGAVLPVAGVGAVDRAQLAQQMAAALVAQGKTDVTSEELAQLVDAVVGMAEAKQRESEVKRKVEARARSPPRASALQLLQSAYDENERKMDAAPPAHKDEPRDAMDDLSDSDLETLLKNFNELSAEEQHSLIAYLKKMEAREPVRVERLRQYVSAAASAPQEEAKPAAAPPPQPAPAAAPARLDDTRPVTIESDDDDYTVEEVLMSATQKVKEDQIRQEMDIVKRSLEESKVTSPIVDLTRNMSSATDLLALVQASLQSTAATPALNNSQSDVVTSNTQPRSFGDLPDASFAPPHDNLRPPLLNTISPLQSQPIQGLMGPGPGSMLQQGQGSMQQQGPGPIQQQGPGPMQQQGPGPIQQQGPGPMQQQGPGPMQQQGPGPMNHQGPGPKHQQGPGPMHSQGVGHMQQQGQYHNQGGYRPPPNQNNYGGNRNFQNEPHNDDNGPWEQGIQTISNNMPENRGPPGRPMGGPGQGYNNFQDQYNQAPNRGNFMNAQRQDNYDRQNMNQYRGNNQFGGNQQYGNMNEQGGNFRGRGGRGQYRGRGRGYY